LSYFANKTPYRFHSPDVWLLGSSHDSAIWAAELGLPYVFADFINPNGAQIARYYRQTFTPSELHPTARTGVAAWAICADTAEEAARTFTELPDDDDDALPRALDLGPDRRDSPPVS